MAKAKMLGKNPQQTGNKYPMLNGPIRDQLHGLSLNDAIQQGLVTELGDQKGGFIFEAADDNIDASYAIVNGKRVQVSSNMLDMLSECKNIDETYDLLGKATFTKGISNTQGDGFGKEFFRLGRPAGVELKANAAISLQLEPVNN